MALLSYLDIMTSSIGLFPIRKPFFFFENSCILVCGDLFRISAMYNMLIWLAPSCYISKSIFTTSFFFSLVFLKNTVGFNWVGYITFLAIYATFEFGLKNEPDIFKVEIV